MSVDAEASSRPVAAAELRVAPTVVLAVVDGCVAFWFLAALLVVAFGHTERVEFASYAVTFFVLAPALAWVAARRRQWLIRRSRDTLAVLAAVDGAVLFAAIVVARFVWLVSPGALAMALVAIGAAALLVAMRVVTVRGPTPSVERLLDHRWFLAAIGPLLFGASLAAFLPASVFAGNDWVVFVAALVVAVALLRLASLRHALTTRVSRVVDGLVVLLLASVLLVVRGQDVVVATYHQGFFLAPANAVLHGQALLVTVFSQYGVGLIYFLAAVFAVIGIGYGLLAVVVAVVTVIEFALLYFVLRLTVRSQAIAVTGVAVAVVACVLTPEQLYVDYPSATALRFGIPFLLIAVEVVAGSSPGKATSWTSAALVGLASFWSFETFVYTALAYIAMVGAAAVRRRRRTELLRASALPLLAVVVVQLGYAFVTRIVAGAWPDWGTYFSYLRLYSTQGFGGLPVGAWSPGFLLGVVYFASALGVWFLSTSPIADDLARQLTATAGFTGFGIASFSYFVGRSHPNNLHVIVVPAVALVVLWIEIGLRLQIGTVRAIRHLAAGLAVVVVAAVVGSGWQNLRAAWSDTALGLVTTVRPPQSLHLLHRDLVQLRGPYPYDSAVADGRDLVARYDPGGRRPVVVLMSGELTDEYLIAAHEANAIPLSDPNQEALLPATRRRVFEAAAGLRADTFVLTDSYPSPASPLDLSGRVYLELKRRYSLVLVGRTPNVALLRFRP
ncbi:MAG: hypothetical protein ACRDLM_12190 [Gaiellaceae bacterium]